MRDIVRAYILKYRLLTNERPVLVAVSGGADSIALLSVLVELGYSCIGLHCNFHLRDEESDRDERFVSEYLAHIGVPLHKIDFDTELYAQNNHLSIEMAARELRYAWFEEKRRELQAEAIAVAHHQDDSVETVLMNLVRGTGIRGLTGIKPKNGWVVRPLLSVSRQQIMDWLSSRNLPYMTDSTNLSDIYIRNFIRLRILPLLEEINPSVREAVVRTSSHLRAVEEVYSQAVREAGERIRLSPDTFSIPHLLATPAPETILYELLSQFDFSRQTVRDIFESLTKESGKLFYSPTHLLLKDRETLILSRRDIFRGEQEIEINPFLTPDWQGPIRLSFEELPFHAGFVFRKEKHIAYFDMEKLSFPLVLRTWKRGDWFVPFGMKGRKKVSDYFSDRKFNRIEKEQIWLLCSGADILWIIGERADNRFRVDHTTKKVFQVKFYPRK